MSLEQSTEGLKSEIIKLNATLERIASAGGIIGGGTTAAHDGVTLNGAAATETTAPKKGRPAGATKAPLPTQEEAMAAAFSVRDTISKAAAAALIKKHGADSLGKLEPKRFAAFIAECEAEVAAHEAAQGGGDDPDDL